MYSCMHTYAHMYICTHVCKYTHSILYTYTVLGVNDLRRIGLFRPRYWYFISTSIRVDRALSRVNVRNFLPPSLIVCSD